MFEARINVRLSSDRHNPERISEIKIDVNLIDKRYWRVGRKAQFALELTNELPVKMMNINMDENTKQPCQDFLAERLK